MKPTAQFPSTGVWFEQKQPKKKVKEMKKTNQKVEVNKFVAECESCGKWFTKEGEYWTRSTDKQVMCADCFVLPLDTLREAYHAKTLKQAKAAITKFDDQCDPSFLED
jgi:hypothetical protein